MLESKTGLELDSEGRRGVEKAVLESGLSKWGECCVDARSLSSPLS